ncbi:hypothetical protein COO60DRAFT_279789 [Scenedesmus sp. NREL 46B-D3]|nr:hypothetical protein COO60DRAFT_279789 [Scenedesmus sp. NREL 46B-D3]
MQQPETAAVWGRLLPAVSGLWSLALQEQARQQQQQAQWQFGQQRPWQQRRRRRRTQQPGCRAVWRTTAEQSCTHANSSRCSSSQRRWSAARQQTCSRLDPPMVAAVPHDSMFNEVGVQQCVGQPMGALLCWQGAWPRAACMHSKACKVLKYLKKGLTLNIIFGPCYFVTFSLPC